MIDCQREGQLDRCRPKTRWFNRNTYKVMIKTKPNHTRRSRTSMFHRTLTALLITMWLGIAHGASQIPGNTMVPFWVETTPPPSPSITLRWEFYPNATEHR